MQNVEQELPGLINRLLQAPAPEQRRLLERYFTPECRLTHALVGSSIIMRKIISLYKASVVQKSPGAAVEGSARPPTPRRLTSPHFHPSLREACGREPGGDHCGVPVLALYYPPPVRGVA